MGTEGDAIAAPRLPQNRHIDSPRGHNSIQWVPSVISVTDVGEGDVHACFDAGVQAGEQVGVGVTALSFELKESSKIKMPGLQRRQHALTKYIGTRRRPIQSSRHIGPLRRKQRISIEPVQPCTLKPG